MNTKPTPPPLVRLRDTLSSVAIRFDQAQKDRFGRSGNGYWNPYALPQYLARIDDVVADVERGAEVKDAIQAGFNGRLQVAMLRALKLPRTEEKRVVLHWHYVPVTPEVEP